MDGIEVMLGALGKEVRLAHQTTEFGPQQGTEEAFDVAGLVLLASAAVGVFGKRRGVGVSIVATGRAVAGPPADRTRFAGCGSPAIQATI